MLWSSDLISAPRGQLRALEYFYTVDAPGGACSGLKVEHRLEKTDPIDPVDVPHIRGGPLCWP